MAGNSMLIKTASPRQEVKEFIGQDVDSPTKLQLLLFWSRHPNTKFTVRTLKHALNEESVGLVERSLEDLTRSGLVNKHIHPHRDVFFSLTAVREIQRLVLEIAKCSRYELRSCCDLSGMAWYHPMGNS